MMAGLSGSFGLRRVSALALAALVSAALLVTGIVPAASADVVSLTVTVRTPAGAAITTGKVTAVSLDDVTFGDEIAGNYKAGRYLFDSLDSSIPYGIRVDTNTSVPNSNYTQFWGGASDLDGAKPWTSAEGSMLDFRLLGGTYSGKVLTPSGVGLPKVDVHLFKWDGVRWSLVKTVVSAATGAYSFPYLEPGSYTTEFDASRGQKAYISVFAGGAAVYGNETVPHSIDKATKFYVTPGKPIVVNQKMTVGGTLSGQALKESQPYSTHLRVAAMAIFGTAPNQTSSTMPMVPLRLDTPLKFKLTGLPTGYYSLSAGGPDQLGGHSDPFTDPAVKATGQRVYYVKAGSNVTGALVDLDPTWQRDAEWLRGSFSPTGQVTGGIVTIGRATDFGAAQDLLIDATGKFEQELPAGLYRYEARPTGPNLLKPVYGEILFTATTEETLVLPAETEQPMAFDGAPSMSPASGSVGTTFTASATSNHPTTSVVTYQWLRDGIPIFGARSASFTAGGGDENKALSVRVGISDLEAFDNVSTTVSAGVVAQGEGITNDTRPSIAAPAVVKPGTVLRANPGTWSEAPVTMAYQWTLGGVPIAGAVGAAFTVRSGDAEKTIGLTVTASKAGHAASAESAADVTVVPLPAPTASIAPKVTASTTGLPAGSVKYAVTSGSWTPAATFSYRWLSDGEPIVGSTGPTYTAPAGSAAIVAEVTAKRVGHADGVRRVVARKGTNPPTQLTAPVIRDAEGNVAPFPGGVLSGTALTADPGTWQFDDSDAVPTFSYQWVRGTGTVIAGAKSATYTVTDADAGQYLSVNITVSAPGYPARVAGASAGYGSTRTGIVDAHVVVSLSSPVEALTPVTAVVDADEGKLEALAPLTTRYQWLYCTPSTTACEASFLGGYKAIVGATGRTFIPPKTFVGYRLGVRVTIAKAGYATSGGDSNSSIVQAFSGQLQSTAPTTTGIATVGGRLAVTPGVKQIAGTTSTFAWRSSTNELLATGATFIPKAEHFTQLVHVVETIKKVGYVTLVRESEPVTIGAGRETLASPLTITTAGLTTRVLPPVFLPLGNPAYSWTVGDSDTVRSELPSFTRTAADAGLPVFVQVSYDSGLLAYSANNFDQTYLAVRGTLTGTALPTITGSRLGDVLQANPPTFAYPSAPGDPKTTYQWYVGGIAISGAKAATYTPPSAASIGKKYTVRVTSTTQNYAVVSVLSPAVTLLAGLNPSGTPTVDVAGGVVKPGAVVTANASLFTLPSQTFTYQWQANTGTGWVSIAAATAKTYKVLPAQVGASLRVIVTGKRLGYATSTGASTGVVVLSSGELPLLTAPALVGTGLAGTTLSVTAPTFGVAGVTLSYRWLRNGVVMPGATATSFVTSAGHEGDSISVEVSAKAPGYVSWVSLLDARVVFVPPPPEQG